MRLMTSQCTQPLLLRPHRFALALVLRRDSLLAVAPTTVALIRSCIELQGAQRDLLLRLLLGCHVGTSGRRDRTGADVWWGACELVCCRRVLARLSGRRRLHRSSFKLL